MLLSLAQVQNVEEVGVSLPSKPTEREDLTKNMIQNWNPTGHHNPVTTSKQVEFAEQRY